MDCIDMEVMEGCASDGVSFVSVKIHTEYRRAASGEIVPYKTRYTLADDSIFALPLGWSVTPGACVAPAANKKLQSFGLNIASGTLAAAYDPDGNGTSWSWAGPERLQSYTVTALRAGAPNSGNTVEVKFSVGRILLAQGQTFTWSVAQDPDRREEIVPDFAVVCSGNAAANIGWTEEI